MEMNIASYVEAYSVQIWLIITVFVLLYMFLSWQRSFRFTTADYLFGLKKMFVLTYVEYNSSLIARCSVILICIWIVSFFWSQMEKFATDNYEITWAVLLSLAAPCFIMTYYGKQNRQHSSENLKERSKLMKIESPTKESCYPAQSICATVVVEKFGNLDAQSFQTIHTTSPLYDIDQLLSASSSRCLQECVEPLRVRTCGKPSFSSSKLLVCHDMKGGYTGDKWNMGANLDETAFQLFHWEMIDVFCYFSHDLVTVPPHSWTSVAHRHGCQVLGTFITEWDRGKDICDDIFGGIDECRALAVATALAALALKHGFDGWLINIENILTQPVVQVPRIILFLKHLRYELRRHNPNAIVMWYDAVTVHGKLEWQNSLTAENRDFFDACDSIFINYTWKPEHIRRSLEVLAPAPHRGRHCERAQDLYFGIDVFGRGSYGGGMYESCKALQELRRAGVSAAVFAPGWVLETQVNTDSVLSSNSDISVQQLVQFQEDLRTCSARLWGPMLQGWVGRSHWTSNLLDVNDHKVDSACSSSISNIINVTFSQGLGRYVFVNGLAHDHPGTCTTHSTMTAGLHGQGRAYYDLNMQDSNWNYDVLNKSHTTVHSKLSKISGSMCYVSAWHGTGSLMLSGVVECKPFLSQSHRQRRIASAVHIPILSTVSSDGSSSASDGLQWTVRDKKPLGTRSAPILVKLALAVENCPSEENNYAWSDIAVLLTFEPSPANTINSSKSEFSQILLISGPPKLPQSGATASAWASRSTAEGVTSAISDPCTSHPLLCLSASRVTEQSSYVAVPDSIKLSNILQTHEKSTIDPNNQDQNTTKPRNTDWTQVQHKIQQQDPSVTKQVHWQIREFLINPLSLADLTSRQLVSVELLCVGGCGVSGAQTRAQQSVLRPFRAYVGLLHISAGKCCVRSNSFHPRITGCWTSTPRIAVTQPDLTCFMCLETKRLSVLVNHKMEDGNDDKCAAWCMRSMCVWVCCDADYVRRVAVPFMTIQQMTTTEHQQISSSSVFKVQLSTGDDNGQPSCAMRLLSTSRTQAVRVIIPADCLHTTDSYNSCNSCARTSALCNDNYGVNPPAIFSALIKVDFVDDMMVMSGTDSQWFLVHCTSESI